ncbi:MAG: hypothetical protein ACJ8E1_04445, partial [Xanthobacteraceae bacterium]
EESVPSASRLWTGVGTIRGMPHAVPGNADQSVSAQSFTPVDFGPSPVIIDWNSLWNADSVRVMSLINGQRVSTVKILK